MKSNKKLRVESFTTSLLVVLLLGCATATLFFGLMVGGVLDHPLLQRYCLNHPVAVACIYLFCIGLVTLIYKWVGAGTQLALVRKTGLAVERLVVDGADVALAQRAQWLDANWKPLPPSLRDSWLGQRLTAALDLQIRRGRRHQIESDLRNLADADSDRQHESYSLLRIINWAMPMLGFLGTVLGISQTLGQLDTQLLATQQQEAMNQLTAGLYVAFDTTAVALILTVSLMFLQFGINRLELNLLALINRECDQQLVGFLAYDPFEAQTNLLTPMREMASELTETVQQLAESQAQIWSRTITETQAQWADWTGESATAIQAGTSQALSQSLRAHTDALEKIQQDAAQQLDTRWHQWQTTLSEQARGLQQQQKSLAEQSQTLQLVSENLRELVESTTDLRRLEETIGDSVGRLENVGRIEEAVVCLGEAVAILGTSLERAQIIRGVPTRPRANSTTSPDNAAEIGNPSAAAGAPSTKRPSNERQGKAA